MEYIQNFGGGTFLESGRKRKWDDNIMINHGMGLVQDHVKWQDLVVIVLNFKILLSDLYSFVALTFFFWSLSACCCGRLYLLLRLPSGRQ
jgi:hypothetical protein